MKHKEIIQHALEAGFKQGFGDLFVATGDKTMPILYAFADRIHNATLEEAAKDEMAKDETIAKLRHLLFMQHCVMAELARTLERELAQARAGLELEQSAHASTAHALGVAILRGDRAEAERDALKLDAERYRAARDCGWFHFSTDWMTDDEIDASLDRKIAAMKEST